MKLNYESEKYEDWVSIGVISLRRKLVYETAFDEIIKIYRLISNETKINDILADKFFCDFIHHASCGVFLRMIESETSWPKTKLVYMDFVEYYFVEIKTTNSSWNVWKGSDLGYGKHSINISPTEKIEYQIKN